MKLILAALMIGMVGCKPKTEYIIPIDFDKYQRQLVPGLTGLTQKDVNAIFVRQKIEIDSNTLGRALPDIMVMDTQGREVNLRSLVNGLTLICFSDAHCGWGIDALVNGVPDAMTKAKNENLEIEAVCLFVKETLENEDMEMFNSKLNELRPLYQNLFIISTEEAKRMNVNASPTIMLIDNEKVVVDFFREYAASEALYEYIKTKTTHNRVGSPASKN